MTEDDKALVERLRDDWPEILVEKHWMMDSDAIDKQREEAADRIEEMAARYEKSQDQIDRLISENERIRERLGWICAVMDLDDDVSLQWVYTELEALRGLGDTK